MKKRRVARRAMALRSRPTTKSGRSRADNGIRNNAIQLLALLPEARADKIAVLECAKKIVLSIYDRDARVHGAR